MEDNDNDEKVIKTASVLNQVRYLEDISSIRNSKMHIHKSGKSMEYGNSVKGIKC